MFWSRWLLASTGVVIVFGFALVVAAYPMQGVFESLYFAPHTRSTLDAEAVAYTAFLQAVLGATMLGWGVLLASVVAGPFRRADSSAWTMIASSFAAWFIFDTGFSLWSGYWQNAALNVGLAVLFAIPLAATYRRFRSERT